MNDCFSSYSAQSCQGPWVVKRLGCVYCSMMCQCLVVNKCASCHLEWAKFFSCQHELCASCPSWITGVCLASAPGVSWSMSYKNLCTLLLSVNISVMSEIPRWCKYTTALDQCWQGSLTQANEFWRVTRSVELDIVSGCITAWPEWHWWLHRAKLYHTWISLCSQFLFWLDETNCEDKTKCEGCSEWLWWDSHQDGFI